MRGMTLVELLIAVSILSLALLAYLSVALASRGAVDKGHFLTRAAQAAGDKITEYRTKGYDGISFGTTTYNVAGLPEGLLSVVVGPLDNDAANANIKQIDVTVTWAASGGTQTPYTSGRVTHSTLVSNRL